MTLKVVYRDGAFIPQTACVLPDGAEGTVSVDELQAHAPDRDEAIRRELAEIVADMVRNPLPANSPRFTRDELHERR